ncbi:MAG: TspO/MBR family protein [Hyphomicrobiaceae bacterium]
MPRQIAMLVAFVLVTAAVSAFGAIFRPGDWYAALAKPPWNPPNWVFAPVWTILYIMIAVAGWLAWRAEGFGRAVAIWALALVANGLWSWIFFGRQLVGPAFVDIVLLLVLIASFIAATWTLSRTAALLFIPYFAWVAYASTLNGAIWVLNR